MCSLGCAQGVRSHAQHRHGATENHPTLWLRWRRYCVFVGLILGLFCFTLGLFCFTLGLFCFTWGLHWTLGHPRARVFPQEFKRLCRSLFRPLLLHIRSLLTLDHPRARVPTRVQAGAAGSQHRPTRDPGTNSFFFFGAADSHIGLSETQSQILKRPKFLQWPYIVREHFNKRRCSTVAIVSI